MERRDFEQKTNIDQGGLVHSRGGREGGRVESNFMYVISRGGLAGW